MKPPAARLASIEPRDTSPTNTPTRFVGSAKSRAISGASTAIALTVSDVNIWIASVIARASAATRALGAAPLNNLLRRRGATRRRSRGGLAPYRRENPRFGDDGADRAVVRCRRHA